MWLFVRILPRIISQHYPVLFYADVKFLRFWLFDWGDRKRHVVEVLIFGAIPSSKHRFQAGSQQAQKQKLPHLEQK